MKVIPETIEAIWPRPLEPGDLVGVTAPAGPPDPLLLETGITFLEGLGFRILRGRCLGPSPGGYLAADDELRSDDLNDMLRNIAVRGVVCARGGYGSMRILDRVDGFAAASRRLALVGMSDLTAIELSLFRAHGLVTFAGPMVAGQIGSGLDDFSRESFRRALTEPAHGRDLFASLPNRVETLREGRARGPLVGGCLTLIAALLGTGRLPSFSGAILLLEDVNEPLYRVDRMLTQLKLGGALDDVRGVVCGHFVGPDGEDLGRAAGAILLEYTRGSGVPVVVGFPHGHRMPNATVPIGAPVCLDTRKPALIVL
jgi:muramoyltetrapeptide carboxypeptidase